LSANATVKITIYDIFGRVVRRIECNPGGNGGKFGENYVSWDGKNEQGEKVSTGMYICVIEGTNGGSNERKIVKIGVIR
jgi:flagellar hook assembly protein FlgD